MIKGRTTYGLRRAVRGLWEEFQIYRSHRASLKQVKRFIARDVVKLNLGCGPNPKPDWINVDLGGKADLHLDLREKFPFADDSVSVIYSEHFFEHLEYPGEATNFLRESYRVLKPGGLFSVGIPDTEWALTAYVTGDQEFFRLASERWHPKWCDTRMHHMNYHFRLNNEHKYAYDFETLERVLQQIGFRSINRRSFNPELDNESRRDGTLYVDARK